MRRRSIILALAVSATTLAVAQSIDTGVGLATGSTQKTPASAASAKPTPVPTTQDPTTGRNIPVAVALTSVAPSTNPAAAPTPAKAAPVQTPAAAVPPAVADKPKLPSTPEELLNQPEPKAPTAAPAATASAQVAPDTAPAATPIGPTPSILATGTPAAGNGPTLAQLAGAEARAAGDEAALPQPSSKMNPYTGLSMATEALLRQLDAAKLETALLEERMKQQNLMAEMELLPARKRAEAATLVKDVRTEAKAIKAEQDGTGPAVVKAAPKPTVVKPKIAEPVVVAPPAPKIEVTSLISGTNGISAVVDLNGNTVVLREGDDTPFGRMKVVDESTILLGERRYSVHGHTLARMVVSDPKPVDMKQRIMGGSGGTTATGLPLPPSIPSSALPNTSGTGTLRSVPPPLPTSN